MGPLVRGEVEYVSGPDGALAAHIVFYTLNNYFLKDSTRGREETGAPKELLTST